MFDKSTDIARFTELYTNPNVTIDDICHIFKYAPGSIYRMAFELGLKRPRAVRGVQLGLKQVRAYCERVSQALPPTSRLIAQKAYQEVKGAIDFILLLSDEHTGRLTVSYNANVFGNRMIVLGSRILQHISYFSRWAPIGRLNIFRLGDTVTGERVGANIVLEELEHVILTQCFGIAIPHIDRFIRHMLDGFSAIDIYCVPGNHGVVARPQMSESANWDNVVNYGLQSKLADHKEVTFDVETVKWYNFATVKNLDWLLIHGDQFRGGCNYNKIANDVTQWHQTMPEHFDYVAMAHFHHFNKVREILMNGTLLTNDDWSLEVVKRDAECVQVLIAVSDKGIEDIMPIWLDDVGEEV